MSWLLITYRNEKQLNAHDRTSWYLGAVYIRFKTSCQNIWITFHFFYKYVMISSIQFVVSTEYHDDYNIRKQFIFCAYFQEVCLSSSTSIYDCESNIQYLLIAYTFQTCFRRFEEQRHTHDCGAIHRLLRMTVTPYTNPLTLKKHPGINIHATNKRKFIEIYLSSWFNNINPYKVCFSKIM